MWRVAHRLITRASDILHAVACWLSLPIGFFVIASTLVLGVAVGIPFRFNDTWLLFYNLYMSAAALLLAGIILVGQNRSALGLQAKLDELILASNARNELIGADEMSEEDIGRIRKEQHHEAGS